jgi:transposase-like protein
MAKKKRTVIPKEFKPEAVRLVFEKDMSAAQVVFQEEDLFWPRRFQMI